MTIKTDDSATESQLYEAAIKYFMNQLPLERRPYENDEIDVSKWVSGRIELRLN